MIRVPPSGPSDAQVMFVGEAPGEQETRMMAPFVGPSGAELDKMLIEAGLLRSQAFITNVCRARPPQNKIDDWIYTKKTRIPEGFVQLHDAWVHPEVREGYELLLKEISAVKPKLIIAFGNTPLWALSGKKGITSFRGSTIEVQILGEKYLVLPAFHPAAVLRNWAWREVTVHDLRKAKNILEQGVDNTPYNFIVRPTYAQTVTRLEWLLANYGSPFDTNPWIAVDIETRAHSHIACIGIAWSPHDAICIPLMCTEAPEGYFTFEEELHVIRLLQRLLTTASCVGQNFLYDEQYFANHFGFVPNTVWDTMGAQHTLFPGTPKDLNYLSSIWCKTHTYWKDEGKEWNLKTGEEQLWIYNCKDACATLEISFAQKAAVERANMTEVNEFQLNNLRPKVLKMMVRGVKYNHHSRASLSVHLEESIKHVHRRIEYLVDHPFNPKSPQQMKALFYDDFAQIPIYHPKNKTITLDDNATQKIAERTPILRPLINLIADYRSLNVFKSTFIDAAPSLDGRMRTAFNPFGTYTFRFSSSQDAFGRGMNLQNLPTEGSKSLNKAKKRGSVQLFPDVRALFTPDEGYYFWNIDLDRADLQVVVWEADDKELKQMLREGVDLHKENAKVLFSLQSVADVTKSMREFAKSFAHGTNYGGSSKTMATACGVTVHQADLAQRRWFGAHPGIKEWHQRTEEQLYSKRMVTNKLGYRMVFFDRVEGLLPEALAWVPQSTVACVINRALCNIVDNLPTVHVLLQVHDSVAGQAPLDFSVSRIQEQALIEIPYDDPLTIACSVKVSNSSWGACE